MASKSDRLRKAYEFKIGKDRTSKLTDQQISLLSKYYNGLSQNQQQNIDSALFQGRTCELTDMADAFIDESRGVVGGKTSVYKPEDKFVDDKKEFAKEQERKLDQKLEETSDAIMDAIDELIAADKKRFEDFKKQQQKDAVIRRRTAEVLDKLKSSKKNIVTRPKGGKLKRNPEFGYNQYEKPIGPLPMQGPKQAKKGLLGTREVLNIEQVSKKYGLDTPAPVPMWGRGNRVSSSDDWESEVPDQLGSKLDDILEQVRNEPLPSPKKSKKKGKSGKTPLGKTKRYDFDPSTKSNSKKLNLILENIVETRKALFQLYKINKERFEFKKTVDKRLTRDLEAKQSEKRIEKGTKKKEPPKWIVKIKKDVKKSLIEGLIGGLAAAGLGLLSGAFKFNPFGWFGGNNPPSAETGGKFIATGPDTGYNTTIRTHGRELISVTPLDNNYTQGQASAVDGQVRSPERNFLDRMLFPSAAASPAPASKTIAQTMNDKYTLNFLATAGVAALEAGDAQARADVAQSIFNRYDDLKTFEGQRDYLGPSGKRNYKQFAGTSNDKAMAYIILKENQYQPVYADPNAGAGVASDKWMNILNSNDPFNAIVDAMQDTLRKKKNPTGNSRALVQKLLVDSIRAIDNINNMAKAKKGVGGRTEFLGSWSGIASSEEAETFRRGTYGDNINNQFFGAYGSNSLNNKKIMEGAAPTPSNVLYRKPTTKPSTPTRPSIPPPPPKMNMFQWMMKRFGLQSQVPAQSSGPKIDAGNMGNVASFSKQTPQQPLN